MHFEKKVKALRLFSQKKGEAKRVHDGSLKIYGGRQLLQERGKRCWEYSIQQEYKNKLLCKVAINKMQDRSRTACLLIWRIKFWKNLPRELQRAEHLYPFLSRGGYIWGVLDWCMLCFDSRSHQQLTRVHQKMLPSDFRAPPFFCSGRNYHNWKRDMRQKGKQNLSGKETLCFMLLPNTEEQYHSPPVLKVWTKRFPTTPFPERVEHPYTGAVVSPYRRGEPLLVGEQIPSPSRLPWDGWCWGAGPNSPMPSDFQHWLALTGAFPYEKECTEAKFSVHDCTHRIRMASLPLPPPTPKWCTALHS